MGEKISPVLITGAAGFIGAALSHRLLCEGEVVVGVDNLNAYYDPQLKKARIKNILNSKSYNKDNWIFYDTSLEDNESLSNIFKSNKPRVVINLAAQAGVRYSLENPYAYIQSNLVGFSNILELCREYLVSNLIYASSSSVYGGNKNLPFKEIQPVNHPVSLYAATKKSNELMAHTYSHLYRIPSTGLRFFTVYGPWGRPDMAPMIFAEAMLSKKPISVYNFGNMERDFTYIDDVIEGVFRCCYKPASVNKTFNPKDSDQSSSFAPYRIFNIGNSNPIGILNFIEILEKSLGVKAIKKFQPIQPGDVESTAANTDLLEDWIGFKPSTSIETGIEKFAKWYKDYYD